MKVVGSGAPRMLTIRVKSSEVKVLREVLCDHRAAVLEAAAVAQAPRVLSRAVDDGEVEGRHEELFLVAKALDDLRDHAPGGEPRVLVGPTWLLDPIIRCAASEAAERLSVAIDVFRADKGQLSADQLRAALDAACASTSTLIALDRVQNHAVE